MKKLILLIPIIFIINACHKTGNNYFTKFPSEYYLEGEIIKTEIPFKFGTPYLFDSLIIVTNTFDSKRLIHLYSRTDYKYLSSSATIGKGPGEISNPFRSVLDKQNQTIWCMDHGKRKILKFPIDSILINSNYIPSYSVPLPFEQRLIIKYEPFKDELFSFLNNELTVLISFFDHSGNVMDSLSIANNIGFYKDSWEELKKFNKLPYIYNFHPSKNKIVIAFRFSDIIKILDKKGNIFSSIQGPDKINHDPLAPLIEASLAYFDVRSDKKYIYGLYQGTKRVRNENEQLTSTFPHNLFVFNWKLKPITRINFEYSVSSFAIDQLNQRIITFSPDFGDFVIYKLPELLKNKLNENSYEEN